MRSPISATPDCRFLAPVYPGDTLSASSEVIGLKENSSRKTGIVYVRSRGFKQDGDDRARIRALGDGAKARRERAARRAITCRELPKRSSRGHSAAACPPIDVAGL